jgi:diadenosine tetraphosphate (Ap4A) HIT family hydrolase/HKD family nuclease
MPQSECSFCNADPARVFLQSDLIVGLWDAFPVSAGHALLVTRRHVASWFDATDAERQALTEAVQTARQEILRRHAPDGFNIGVNVGEAAGQTVPHLHVHVIPRYRGDIPDPRGGIRHVIPGRGNYLADLGRHLRTDRYLVTGGDDPLLPHIISQLASADRADIVVSFALESGGDRVFEHFRDLLDRGGQLRILTGDYLGITEPNALMRLLDLEGNVERRVFETATVQGEPAIRPLAVRSFHPKAYIFGHARGGTAFVGSSNLSASALTSAVEWNYRILSSRDGAGYADAPAAFNHVFRHPCTKVLTAEWGGQVPL